MKKILLSLIAAALIAVGIPFLILKCFAPSQNAQSTAPVPPATEAVETEQ